MTVPVSWVVQNGIFVSVCLSFLLFFFLLSCIWAVTSGCGWVWFGLAASKHILFAHLFFLESSFFSFLGSSSASSFFVSFRFGRFVFRMSGRRKKEPGFRRGEGWGHWDGGLDRHPLFPRFCFWSFFTFRPIFASIFFFTNMFHKLLLIGLSPPSSSSLCPSPPFCVFTLTSIPLRLESKAAAVSLD